MEQIFLQPHRLSQPLEDRTTVALHMDMDMDLAQLTSAVAFPTRFEEVSTTEELLETGPVSLTAVLSLTTPSFTASCKPAPTLCQLVKPQKKPSTGLKVPTARKSIQKPPAPKPVILPAPVIPPTPGLKPIILTPDNTKLDDSFTNISLPASEPLQLTLPSGQPIENNKVLMAYYIYLNKDWGAFKRYITSSAFPPAEHTKLQGLWYEALYEEFREWKGLDVVTPPQRYRIRKKNTVPESINSSKFVANKFIGKKEKRLMNSIFHKSPYISNEQRDFIMAETGLNKLQVKNYFKNKRMRSK